MSIPVRVWYDRPIFPTEIDLLRSYLTFVSDNTLRDLFSTSNSSRESPNLVISSCFMSQNGMHMNPEILLSITVISAKSALILHAINGRGSDILPLGEIISIYIGIIDSFL